jgi:hypothetical protein
MATPQKTLTELLADYKEKLEESKIDLNLITDYRQRPGAELRKNGATNALVNIRAEIVRAVEQNSAAVFLTGLEKGIETFIGHAHDLCDGNIVILSAQELYEKLAAETVRGIRRDRRFSIDCFSAFVVGLRTLLDELSINETIPAPNMVPYLNNVFEDDHVLTIALKTALNATKTDGGVPTGDALNLVYLQTRAAEDAIKEDVSTNFLPVIVLGATPEEIAGHLGTLLYFGRTVAFDVKDEETTEATVKAVFQKLKVAYSRRGVRQTKGS